jgi:tRNA(Glu) U13 pseudouridine synthase TruD
MAATQSKAKAADKYRSQAFDSALQRSFDSGIDELNSAQKIDLLTEEKAFLEQGSEILGNINELQRKLTEVIIREEMKSMDVEVGEVDTYGKDEKGIIEATIVKKETADNNDDANKKTKGKKKSSNKKVVNKLIKEIEKENTELLKLEMEFIKAGKVVIMTTKILLLDAILTKTILYNSVPGDSD